MLTKRKQQKRKQQKRKKPRQFATMRFQPIILFTCISAISAREPIPDPKPLPKPGTVGLCDIKKDCDLDIDCATGLICADAHKAELIALGYDDRAADCPNVATKPWNWELCFNPKILKPSGGGGGDPHFRTYDGTKYSFHGQCDLVMARSPGFGSGLGLNIHARTEIVSGWSLISNAAVQIGNDVLEIANDGSHYINGVKDASLSLLLAGKYSISKGRDILNGENMEIFTINLGNEEFIRVSNYKMMISVRVDAALIDTEGMLGIHGKVGMIGRDRKTVIDDANEMGSQWQVRDDEPRLFYELRAPQYPAQCVLPKTPSRQLRLAPAEVAKAEEACKNIDEEMHEFCVHDVLLTGDTGVAHGYGFAF
jgi:von Willebrand factor type D domain